METEDPTELTMKDMFNNVNLDLIPENLRFELETIQDETSDFSDEDVLSVWDKNFTYIYFSIKKKHPEAMRDYVAPVVEEPIVPELTEGQKKALEIANKYKGKVE